jgi:hypothetical protein
VREHAYYEARSPLDELGRALARRTPASFAFGPERWPYFGGPGWADELSPSLARHTDSTSPPARNGRHHAFVVDVRPRTPQARRRLVASEP